MASFIKKYIFFIDMGTKMTVFWRKFKRSMKEFRNNLTDKFLALLFFGFAGLCFWILIQMLYLFYGFSLVNWIKDLPYLYDIFTYFFTEIKNQTDIGLFYMFAFSSLFFLPVPLEALFFNFMKTMVLEKIFVIAIAGIMVGQLVNYFLGRFLGFIFIKFIKKKTKRSMKSKLSKYGIFAVIFVHIIPFPFQIFNFISGILKYKFFRWTFFAIVGLVIKHLVMYWIYVKFF